MAKYSSAKGNEEGINALRLLWRKSRTSRREKAGNLQDNSRNDKEEKTRDEGVKRRKTKAFSKPARRREGCQGGRERKEEVVVVVERRKKDGEKEEKRKRRRMRRGKRTEKENSRYASEKKKKKKSTHRQW